VNKRILFSPVGGHDPVASYHDGAILHICRVYRPEKVYLYLSKEMVERSRLDDRYRESLRLLGELSGCAIAKIEMIEREELTQVQLFDAFYSEFEQLLQKIHGENPEAELLVNLSSGTPAMKSALDVITVLAPYPMCAVQVSTPNERENPKDEKPEEYDVEAFWATNQDNEANFKNRCHEVRGEQLLVKIKKESIRRLLDAYDYRAAVILAQEIKDSLTPRAMAMLKAAECRSQLDLNGYARALNGFDVKFMPVEAGNQRKIFEYALSLQSKLAQGSYADFLRGLTPVIADLFEIILRNHFGVRPEEFCRRRKLSEEVMLSSPRGKEIRGILIKRYGLPLKEGYLSSHHILAVIEGMAGDADSGLVDDLERLRFVEEAIRNTAAHEIESITEEWIRRKTKSECVPGMSQGMSSAEILKLLKRVVHYAEIHANTEAWNSYDRMNRTIAEELAKPNL